MFGLKPAEASLSLELLEKALQGHAVAEATARTLTESGQELTAVYEFHLVALRHQVFENYVAALEENREAEARALVKKWRTKDEHLEENQIGEHGPIRGQG